MAGAASSDSGKFSVAQPIFSEDLFSIFTQLAAQAQSGQAAANQDLIRLVSAQTHPIAFLFQLLLQDGRDENVALTASELLRGQLKATTFAEFQCQVPQIEQVFTSLVLQLVQTTASDRLQGLLVRLVCCLATEYWLDSQCFENFFTSQLAALQSSSAKASRMLLTEILASMKVLVASCQSSADFEDADEAEGTSVNSAPQSNSLSHKAFKTVQLFKSTALLTIFELAHYSFANQLGQANPEGLRKELALLTDVLKLHKLQINQGKNQMQFRLILKDEARVTLQKISEFCAPQNISQLLQHLVIDDNMLTTQDGKAKAAELIRCMTAILGDNLEQSKSTIEIDRAPFSTLLAQILSVVKAGSLPQDTIIKLMHRCNHSLFGYAGLDAQTEWLKQSCETLRALTQSFEDLKLGTFQLIVQMWKPITNAIDHGDTQGELSIVGPYLADQAKRLTVKLLESLATEQTFDEGDPFDEELSNPKGVKEIALTITSLALLKPLDYLASLKELLGQVMAPGVSQSPRQVESLCWLIHLLRVFYAQLFPLINPEHFSKVEHIQAERAQASTECAQILLRLKPQVEQAMAPLIASVDPALASCLQYAVMKAVECLARSFLSRQIRYDPQLQYVQQVASSAGLQSKDGMLTTVIQFALETLSSTSSNGSKSQINQFEKSALKILVLLTSHKPMVNKEQQIMRIKHFDVNLSTLVALKDYLCNALQGINGHSIRRSAIKSLVELMTEFDTLSNCQEVVNAIYAQMTQSVESVESVSPKQGLSIGVIGHIENLRGVYEGTYRQSQFMALIKSFLAEPPVGAIRARLDFLIVSGNEGGSSVFADMNERAYFVKTMLGLVQEISYNRDDRMGFVEHTCQQLQFLQCMIGLVQKCLAIIRDFNLGDSAHQQSAMSLVKRAMKVCLYLGLNEIMNQKQMEMLTALKSQFQATLSLLVEGLKSFVPPLHINQLKQSTQSLIFKLIYLLFERHFGLVLELAKRDITNFDYLLELVAEGIQSTQSSVFLSSVESFETMFNRGWKTGNSDFRNAMIELISRHPRTVQVFKMLLKQNLRTFIRGEQTNLQRKIQVTLRLVTMYLSIQETQFYPICAAEVAKEAANGNQQVEAATYCKLIDLIEGMDWKRKRIEPNVKQVYRKLVPQPSKIEQPQQTNMQM